MLRKKINPGKQSQSKKLPQPSFKVFLQNWYQESNKRLLLIAVFVLALSFYLRIEPVLFQTIHFSFDQGLDQILVKKLVVDKEVSLISRYTGLEGVFMGPLFTWIMAIPFVLSGGNPQANVVFLSLVGIVASVAGYVFVKKMTDTTTGLLAGFFIAISPVFVGASKIVLSPVPLTFLAILYVYILWQIIYEKKDAWLPWLALLVSIFFQFEIGYAIFVLPATLVSLFLFRGLHFLKAKQILLSGLLFILPFLPQIAFDFRHNFLISNSIKAYVLGDNTSLGSVNLTILDRLISRAEIITQDFFSLTAFRQELIWLGLWGVALLVWGQRLIFQSNQRRHQQLTKLSLAILVSIYTGFIIYSGPVWPWYRAGIPFLVTLLIALSYGAIWRSSVTGKLIISGTLLVNALVGINIPDRLKVINDQEIGTVSTFKNQLQVVDFIYQDAAGEPFALYIYTAPVYPWIWDYQLWWYAQPTYGYLPQPYDRMPQKNNPELVYLLIEPAEYETDQAGWKDNFNHVGFRIETQTFASGIQVEKWRFDSEPENPSPLIKYVDVFSSN